MGKIVEVKNIKIGEGIPKVTVPLVGTTNTELIEEVKELKKFKFDILEWRADFYENVEQIEKVKEMLEEIRAVLPETPILFTFRTKKEGGEREVAVDYYVRLNCEIAETKKADLIDIELFTGDDFVRKVVKTAHDNGVKVVMSNHDFFKTPTKEEIVSRLTKMIGLDADLPKVAVMPQNKTDVLILLSATNEMKEKYSNQPIITMSMSEVGVISRICGEFFGSALTFGCAKKASAPGQIALDDLNSVLQMLHRI